MTRSHRIAPKILITLALTTANLVACDTSPPFPEAKLAERRAFLQKAMTTFQRDSDSVTCANPAVPTGLKDAKNWRYGCFCGGNYPSFDASLSGDSLLQKYYSIRPKDEIDRACRDHDVCYVNYGVGDGGCNQVLSNDLSALFDAYMEARKKLPEKVDGKRPYSKCTQTILDIEFAFETAFAPNTYNTRLEGWSGKIARWVFGTPILGTASLLSGDREYPQAEELCNWPNK